jgi:hypothetical protein
MKTKELTAKQILSVPCPRCGAVTLDACEPHTGALRTLAQRDRKLSAAEAVRPSSIAESPDKTSSGQGSNFDQTSEGSE